jgi:signal transduction histidine kinase
LRKNEERLRAFITASAEVVYRMSPDWTQLYALESKNFLVDVKDPNSGWMEKYIFADDQPALKAAIPEAIRTKTIFQQEHRILRADGSIGWVSSRAVPLIDDRGETIEWFGAASDITARRQMEEDLRQSRTQLELRVRQRTVELERLQTDLRDLSGKLLQLQDEERRRISRDLHDSAGQTLTVLAMSLGHLQQLSSKGNGQFTEKIREAQDLLQRVTQEIRTTSYLLHPPLLDETGITAALRWYIEGLAQRTSLKIELHIPDNFERLPPETELAMFRIVQESLTNVLRHAGSDIAIIRISREPDEVMVEIEDHGKGISEEKLAAINQGGSGVGICGMR